MSIWIRNGGLRDISGCLVDVVLVVVDPVQVVQVALAVTHSILWMIIKREFKKPYFSDKQVQSAVVIFDPIEHRTKAPGSHLGFVVTWRLIEK